MTCAYAFEELANLLGLYRLWFSLFREDDRMASEIDTQEVRKNAYEMVQSPPQVFPYHFITTTTPWVVSIDNPTKNACIFDCVGPTSRYLALYAGLIVGKSSYCVEVTLQ